jgi:hypothetical protein
MSVLMQLPNWDIALTTQPCFLYLAQMLLLVFGHTFFVFGNWIGLLQ